jgi:hypothetical protein
MGVSGVGVSNGSVETTIADSDADQTVISGEVADVRRRVYSPGIDEAATARLRRFSDGDGTLMALPRG